jgi:hypothetical protein
VCGSDSHGGTLAAHAHGRSQPVATKPMPPSAAVDLTNASTA